MSKTSGISEVTSKLARILHPSIGVPTESLPGESERGPLEVVDLPHPAGQWVPSWENLVSTDFPTTAGAAQTTYAGGVFDADAFVTKLDTTRSRLVFSTYLGGSDSDFGLGIAVDGRGQRLCDGLHRIAQFPDDRWGGPDGLCRRRYRRLCVKLDATGSGLGYSTFMGGIGLDFGNGIAVDGTGSTYVTGWTDSTNFPTTAGAFQTTYAGNDDAFVAKI